MSKVSRFIENELDKVNEYLCMAKVALTLPKELCEESCASISDSLDNDDMDLIDVFNEELPKLESIINDAKDVIKALKKYSFDNIKHK